jgi:hypothetical protein
MSSETALVSAGTDQLVRETAAAFNEAYSAIRLLIATCRKLDRHVATLKASGVVIHSLPPIDPLTGMPKKRRRGRPPGTRNRNKHIWINGAENVIDLHAR